LCLSAPLRATTTWFPIPQFFSTTGVPLAGGQVFSYAAGTTMQQPTYTDSTGLVQNANPVILDSTGKPTQGIWLSSAGYKIVVEDSMGNIQWFQDNLVFGAATSSTAFSAITAATNSNAGNFIASGNTWNFNTATALLIPSLAGCVPTASSSICYDATANKYVFGQNGSTISYGLTSPACAAHNFVNTPATFSAAASCAQPASADISDGTGSGVVARQTSPALTTPSIGGTTITNVPWFVGSAAFNANSINASNTNPFFQFNVAGGAITIKEFDLSLLISTGSCASFPSYVLNGSVTGVLSTITLANGTTSYRNTGLNVSVPNNQVIDIHQSAGGSMCTIPAGNFTFMYQMQ